MCCGNGEAALVPVYIPIEMGIQQSGSQVPRLVLNHVEFFTGAYTTNSNPCERTMATYSTNQFKSGLKVMLDGAPCSIIENEFVKPGKGQAFNRVRLRNLLTGRVLEKTFKSGDSLEGADVIEMEMQYLYNDGESWHFMVPDNFEQYAISANVIGDTKQWVKEQDMCMVTLWNNEPILIDAPNFVSLKVTETDPGVRGDTATSGSKPATLETGAVIRVPLFIAISDLLKVDTRTGEYVSRTKK